ncbi:MAG: DUF6261 family protein [Tannerellaceae bacterium]|jgi:hypothetical protein|nr:DUF6261 family protein [Tannerellaceae bacterium]
MKKVRKFIRLVRRLRNGDHYEFYREIIKLLVRFEGKLGDLLKLMLVLKTVFQKEDEIFKRNARAEETPGIGDTDQQRMTVFRRIKLHVDAAHYNKNPAEVAAAEALDYVINNYKSIPSTSLTQASALIVNLIQDLRLPKYATHIATLDLTEAVDDLEAANNALEEILSEREHSQGSAQRIGNMKTARPNTDVAGGNLADGLNIFYLLAKLNGRTAYMEALGEIIDGMNDIIIYYEKKYAHIGGGGSSKPDDEDDDDEDDDGDLTPSFSIAAQAVTDGSTMYVTLTNPDSAADLFAEAVGATLVLLLDPEAGVTAFDLFPITGLEVLQEGDTEKPVGLKVGPQANSTFDVPTYNAGPCTAWVEKDDVVLANLTGAFYPGSITEGRKQ